MKILLADDDLVMRRLLQRTLERSGFDVVCAGDGRNAAEVLVDPEGPRIAVLDWMMPGLDGPDVCRYVRARQDNPHRYLILLTAREKREDVLMGLEAGADDYLIKPCLPDEIKARVRAAQRILELQDRMEHDLLHDSVTELPSREYFTRRLAENARRATEDVGYQFTVLLVGLDRFKAFNDSLGHLLGDELLKGAGKRLLQAVRAERADSINADKHEFNAVATRFHSDEFAILIENSSGTGNGVRMAERIQSALERAFSVGGHEVFLAASIGIATSEGKWVQCKDILRNADAAMHKAKELGRARYEVEDSADPIAPELTPLQMELDLRKAISEREIEVYYQPIVRLDDGRLHGFEALVRWRHPIRGILAPGYFLDVAEETGLITPIGEGVMREACRQMAEWNTRLWSGCSATISVNISPRQFDPVKLVELVGQVISESAIDPRCLELEVTENLTMKHAERALGVLRNLSELGVSLSLDDFGSGYSSLNYLQKFPIATLKIDRAFIADAETSDKSRAIVKTIIDLGHSLGMRVVAEGIETAGQMRILKDFGCDLGQGYLFSRPVPADLAEQLVVEKEHGFLPASHADSIEAEDSESELVDSRSDAGFGALRPDSRDSHCERSGPPGKFRRSRKRRRCNGVV